MAVGVMVFLMLCWLDFVDWTFEDKTEKKS